MSAAMASASLAWNNANWTWSKEVLANDNSVAQTTMTNSFNQTASGDYPNIYHMHRVTK